MALPVNSSIYHFGAGTCPPNERISTLGECLSALEFLGMTNRSHTRWIVRLTECLQRLRLALKYHSSALRTVDLAVSHSTAVQQMYCVHLGLPTLQQHLRQLHQAVHLLS